MADVTTKKEPVEIIRQLLEAYGVGVRAGVLTPCPEDESAFRKMLGLPAMPALVKADWDDSEGIRRPITLQRPDATEGPDPFSANAGTAEMETEGTADPAEIEDPETEAADPEAEKETTL